MSKISVQYNAFNEERYYKTRGASLNRFKLQIPRTVILEMLGEVAKSISTHTSFLLKQKENAGINFVLMVGGLSNSPIVVQEVKKHASSIPVIVPENPELSVVQGAVMFGWKPDMFKSRKSKRSYGTLVIRDFLENIDPERLMFYDDDNVKKCDKCFDKLVGVDDEVEIDQIVDIVSTLSKSIKDEYRYL